VQIPLQLTFRGMAQSDALAAHVRSRADKLEHLYDRIVSCHVVVELAGHHHRHGERFHVSINLGVPGRAIVVGHAPSDDQASGTAHAAVDVAFVAAERELEDWVKHQRAHRHAESANRKSL
jgi:putative sigma-54 modulation protein